MPHSHSCSDNTCVPDPTETVDLPNTPDAARSGGGLGINTTPDSNPLRPLLAETDLTDIAQTSHFDGGDPDEDRPGTFGNGTKSIKIDYLPLSPSLFDRGGIFRKGV
ncbi:MULTISPECIES: hypothetical protein [Nocardia]|uniref:hypothetical protein n=1 Tax=Nocardia TaxID=1817 RepID=UPI0024590D31|nr:MULTISPECIES: hypothetical protein [Nocardia]